MTACLPQLPPCWLNRAPCLSSGRQWTDVLTNLFIYFISHLSHWYVSGEVFPSAKLSPSVWSALSRVVALASSGCFAKQWRAIRA